MNSRAGSPCVVAGATILAGTDFELLRPGYLVIREGRITELGLGAAPRFGEPAVDARNTIIAPAFINAHTHIGDAFLKDAGFGQGFADVVMPPNGLRFREFAQATADTIRDGFRVAIEQMVASGTSTFVDFREGGLPGVELLKEAVASRPIRAVTLGRFGEYPAQPESVLARNVGGLTAAHVTELEAILERADGFSLPTANDLTDEALRAVATAARAHRRLLAVHVAQVPEDRVISMRRSGVGDVDRILRHLRPDFVVHLTDATEDELDRLAAGRVPAVVCPRGQAAMGTGLPRFDLMLERGMLVAIATDNVMLASPDLLREVEYSSRAIRAVRRDPAFPSARQLLQMITINPARILGQDREIGSLEPGKSADLVIFDAESPNLRYGRDPVAALVSRAEAGDVKAVLHQGRLVHGRIGQ